MSAGKHTPGRYSPENPPPLRRAGESVEDYRVRCGWDSPKASAKHTPGPWFIFANGQCIGGPVGPLGNPSGADTAGLAHCGMSLRTGSEIEANARLIAAAPELLALAQALSRWPAMHRQDGMRALFDAADAAIAKATGSAS